MLSERLNMLRKRSDETGIPFVPGDQASYIKSWLQVLKNDKNEIFRAAADASKATDYILALEKGKAEEPDQPAHADRITASREPVHRYR
jgi:antirestriction protein ArdC